MSRLSQRLSVTIGNKRLFSYSFHSVKRLLTATGFNICVLRCCTHNKELAIKLAASWSSFVRYLDKRRGR